MMNIIIFIVYVLALASNSFSFKCKDVPTGYCLYTEEYEMFTEMFINLYSKLPSHSKELNEIQKQFNNSMIQNINLKNDIQTLKNYTTCMDKILDKKSSETYNDLRQEYITKAPNIDILCIADIKNIRNYENNALCNIKDIQIASWFSSIWKFFTKAPTITRAASDTANLIRYALVKPKYYFVAGSSAMTGVSLTSVYIYKLLEEKDPRINDIKMKTEKYIKEYDELAKECINQKNNVDARHRVIIEN